MLRGQLYAVDDLQRGVPWANQSQGAAATGAQPPRRRAKQREDETDGSDLSQNFHLFLFKVRDANPHAVFDDDDFTEPDQRPADKDVDVLTCRAGHLDDAAHLQIEDGADRHNLPVEFHFNVDRNVGIMGDLLVGSHGLPFEIDRLLAEFIYRGDHFGVSLVAALQNDKLCKLARNVNRGGLQSTAKNGPAASGAGRTYRR